MRMRRMVDQGSVTSAAQADVNVINWSSWQTLPQGTRPQSRMKVCAAHNPQWKDWTRGSNCLNLIYWKGKAMTAVRHNCLRRPMNIFSLQSHGLMAAKGFPCLQQCCLTISCAGLPAPRSSHTCPGSLPSPTTNTIQQNAYTALSTVFVMLESGQHFTMTSNTVIHPSNPASIKQTRLLLRPVPTECPLRPECHGASITRFTVGRPPTQTQVFAVHTNLLTSASMRLAAMYEKSSKGQEWQLTCEHIHPRAFEVFYQYLYTGQMYHPSHYTMVRHHRRATFGVNSVPVIEQIAFQKLCAMFNPDRCRVRNLDLVSELSYHCCPRFIRNYVSGHTAWWMTKDTSTLALWTPVLQNDAQFGRQVALVLAHGGLWPDFCHRWQMLMR